MVIPGSVNVCIPTVGESELLPELINVLDADPAVGRIDLYINEVNGLTRVLELIKDCPLAFVSVGTIEPETFYRSWNHAIAVAREEGHKLAILNDDIVLPKHQPITAALTVWDDHPDVAVLGFDHTEQVTVAEGLRYCSGSFRHGGIPGFAFMVDPLRVEEVDPAYEIWYGDDDLFFTTQRNGHRLGRCYLQVRHAASTTLNRRAWVAAAAQRDRERWEAKWGGL